MVLAPEKAYWISRRELPFSLLFVERFAHLAPCKKFTIFHCAIMAEFQKFHIWFLEIPLCRKYQWNLKSWLQFCSIKFFMSVSHFVRYFCGKLGIFLCLPKSIWVSYVINPKKYIADSFCFVWATMHHIQMRNLDEIWSQEKQRKTER